MKKAIIYLFFGIFLSSSTFAQSDGIAKYLKPSIDGYIHLYFDQQYFLVDQDCPFKSYTRVIKYDKENGGYNSFFTDYDVQNQPVLTGTYKNGKKEGLFKQFYPTGIVKVDCTFENNLPVGKWNYYYPSGNIWIKIEMINHKIHIIDFWDEKGNQKVKDGKGNFNLVTDSFEYNEFGYTGLLCEGRIKEGKPVGIWSNSLVYPKGSPELIGNELFVDTGFVRSNYSYPENTPENASLIRIIPNFNFINADFLQYKNCTIDDIKGFNVYLQNYLNKNLSMIWTFGDVPDTFKCIVKVNENGQSTEVILGENIPEKFGRSLKFSLERVPFWIPSYKDGNTIKDEFEITFSKVIDDTDSLSFGYPMIKRKNGN
jgi:hypothetical protein